MSSRKSSASLLDRLRHASTWKWLSRDMGVRRWLVLLICGVTLLGLGFAFIFVDLYRNLNLPAAVPTLTVLVGGLGIAAIVIAVIRLNRSILSPFIQPGDRPVADIVYRHYQRGHGPKVVAIGGGTGLSTFLRGIKQYTANITGIVTVADDGGSSGRLRREMGVLPPGDFRSCLAALADDEALTTQLFQYRFGQVQGLGGHAFGNLFITAMADVSGSFEQALIESSRVLAIVGRILPSTLSDIQISAEILTEQGLRQIDGESAITHSGGKIERVVLHPTRVRPYPESIRAILEADLVVLGPGSLYTSVLPNLLIDGIPAALRASRALVLYVCNVATQHGETDGYSIGDHVQAIERHIGGGVIDAVLANARTDVEWTNAPAGVGEIIQVEPSFETLRIIPRDVIDETYPWRHDSLKLARAVIQILGELPP